MRYGYGGLPIRTKETLKAYRLQYFDNPKQRQEGEVKTPLSPLLLTPANTTLLVVRVLHRVKCIYTQTVHNKRGNSYITHCDYYKGAGTDYRVVEVDCHTGAVEELSTHATRDEADAALYAHHRER